MAGSERRGLAEADAFLFQNAIYALTPSATVPWEETERLGRFLGETGARLVVLQPSTHDRVAATVSHLPQLLAVALVNSLDELGEFREEGVPELWVPRAILVVDSIPVLGSGKADYASAQRLVEEREGLL